MIYLRRAIIPCIVVGLIIGFVGVVSGGATSGFYLDWSGLHAFSQEKVSITEHDLGPVTDIQVDVSFSDVEFLEADDFGIDIQAHGDDWGWTLQEETLRVFQERKGSGRITFMNFGFAAPRSSVKIYLPKGAVLDDVSVDAHSGLLRLTQGFTARDVRVSNSFGDVALHGVIGDTLVVDMDSGNFVGEEMNLSDFEYENSFGSGDFQGVKARAIKINSDSGALTLRDCETQTLQVETSFGKVTADRLTSAKTNIDADSGDIDLTGDFTGETEITSDFGSVNLVTSRSKAQYTYDIEVDFGAIYLDDAKHSGSLSSGGTAPNSLDIDVSSGDIRVSFSD